MIAAALLFALALWWASTGAVLWLARLPVGRGPRMAVASVGAAGAAAVLWATREVATPAGAAAAFTAAVALWGWHELSFLTGVVTGPSASPCPPGARGWRRFRAAAATLIHHELALAATAAVVAAATLGGPDPVGGWTFLALFAARLSAKLNLFLGAPSFSPEFFPPHLRHLTTYLRKGPVSPLFPISLCALAASAAAVAAVAMRPEATGFDRVGYTLVAALLALAALEHVFMALPLADTALWRWALPAAERPRRPSRRTSAHRATVHVDAVESPN